MPQAKAANGRTPPSSSKPGRTMPAASAKPTRRDHKNTKDASAGGRKKKGDGVGHDGLIDVANLSSYTWITPEQVEELSKLELEEIINKIATYQSIVNWREDLQTNIFVSYHFYNYLFAKDRGFDTPQTVIFCSIMKYILVRSHEKSWSLEQSLAAFKRVLFDHGASPSTLNLSKTDDMVEVFGSEDTKAIIEYASTTFFQHFRLYQHVTASQQETANIEEPVKIETPFAPLPLAEATTLEAYESEQERIRLEEDAKRQEAEAKAAEEKNKAVNPLDLLSPEEIKNAAADAVQAAINGLATDLDKAIEESKQRYLAQLGKLTAL